MMHIRNITAAGAGGYLGLGEGWICPIPGSDGGPSNLSYGTYAGAGSSFSMASLGPDSTDYYTILSYGVDSSGRGSDGQRYHTISCGGNVAVSMDTSQNSQEAAANLDKLIFPPGVSFSPWGQDNVKIECLHSPNLADFTDAGFDILNLVPSSGITGATTLSYATNTAGCKIWWVMPSSWNKNSQLDITDSSGIIMSLVGNDNSASLGGPSGQLYLPAGYGFSSAGYNLNNSVAYKLES